MEEAIAELIRLNRRALSASEQCQGKRNYDELLRTDKGKALVTDEPGYKPVSLNWKQLALELPKHSSIARLANVCMGSTTSSGFRDPVELGIVSMMEMQCVYSQ